ncbi:hypothetical protein [Tardiphaga sp. 619_E2_N8_5]|uniref:hypothetical protein n=1 Tax=unclassified Tardiphaga TaxID=2631404 RepID=UPI003F259019
MRVRWIIVAGAIGLLAAWWYQNLVAAYITVFSCLILFALRVISVKMSPTVEDVDFSQSVDQ